MITLTTMVLYTQQQIFNQITTHLLTQNKPAYRNGSCYYRLVQDGQPTLKCAVGCCISDAEYDKEMENRSITQREFASFKLRYSDESFLQDLQSLHDNTEAILWPKALAEFAMCRGLTMPVIT